MKDHWNFGDPSSFIMIFADDQTINIGSAILIMPYKGINLVNVEGSYIRECKYSKIEKL